MLKKTTPVPNQVFDLYLRELKIAELKVLLVIIRQTLGWKDEANESERKQCDWISGGQLEKKTGCSRRSIVSAIQMLTNKELIEVLSENGNILPTSEERKGKQKLYYRLSPCIFSSTVTINTNGENKGKASEEGNNKNSTYAKFAEDLRKMMRGLAQKMRITK